MNQTELDNLLALRWEQACNYFPELRLVVPTYAFGNAPHFSTTRGFATMVYDGASFHLKLSDKLLSQTQDRVDAIIRHEIGHIVDFSGANLPPGLPATPERRADAIAELIWGVPLLYDAELVQSLEKGVYPRPEQLGL